MKKILILICLLNTIYSYSQDFENCIDSLYSQNFLTKLFAVECINDLKIYEALDALGELLDSQPPYLQIKFLNALYSLQDPQIQERAHELISRADGFDEDPEHPYDPLEAKVFATAILVCSGDFSTIDYVFERLNQDEITSDDALAFQLLPYIMDNVSSYREEAKNILLNELTNEDVDIRYYALLYLAEEFGEEMNSELVDKFEDDIDLPTRTLALEHLCINNYSYLNSLLKQQLELEVEPSLRIDIADSLSIRFGEPSDLKAVKDYQPNEPDETARSLMGYSIDEFIPQKPEASVTIDEMLNKLDNYIRELYNYSWILSEAMYSEFDAQLTVIENSINMQIPPCYSCGAGETEKFMNMAAEALEKENITNEGYKFLYYYPSYIKERLEQSQK